MPEKLIKTHFDGKYEIRSDLRITNESVKVSTPKCKRNRNIFNGLLLACGLCVVMPFILSFYGIHTGMVGGGIVISGIIVGVCMVIIRATENDPYSDTTYVSVPKYEMSVKLYSRPNKSSPHAFDTRSVFTFPLKHEWMGKILIRGAIKNIEKEMGDLEIQRQAPEELDKVHERIIAGVVVREKPIFRSDNRFSDIEIANAED